MRALNEQLEPFLTEVHHEEDVGKHACFRPGANRKARTAAWDRWKGLLKKI
jgi:hypothetical protein